MNDMIRETIRMRPAHVILAMIAIVLAPLSALARDIDRWYVIQLGDQRAGWMRYQEIDTSIGYRSISEIHIEVARGEVPISVDLKTEFYETYDGKPYELKNEQTLGAMPIKKSFRWEEERIKATVTQNNQSTVQSLPLLPGDWLTPVAARRFVTQQLKDGAKEFSYSTIDAPNGPNLLRVSAEVVGHEIVEALGKTAPAVVLKTEQSAMPGVVTTEYVTEDALPIVTELSVGPLEMKVVLSEREVALASVEPAEIMVSTLIKPNRSITDPRQVRSATYLLSVMEGELPDVPETAVQRVERLSPRAARVTVDLSDETTVDKSLLRDPRFREGSAMIDWRDKAVAQLAEQATNGNFQMPRPLMAERMRRFVHDYIAKKNLDIGLASASETARTGEGDCTEHATLLAAMLRVMGIPSRVVGGLIYAEEFAGRSRIFGYHMWTQALLENPRGEYRWVDFDATLAGPRPFDATHIALSLSTMGDNDMINSMAALAPILGRLDITIERIGDEDPS